MQRGSRQLVEVDPDDDVRLSAVASLQEAARLVDDPAAFPSTAGQLANLLRHGTDLEPPTMYALESSDDGLAGLLSIELPQRDNRHLVFADVVVHPDVRRRGHGSFLMRSLLDLTTENERRAVWVRTARDSPTGDAFLRRRGFGPATTDVRRDQALADVDWIEVDRLAAQAGRGAAAYELVHLRPPLTDDLLQELVGVTDAINDAPMGELDFEPEVFDLDRLRAAQTADGLSGDAVFRVVARHRQTGAIGGHTVVAYHPGQPTLGHQRDTAVAMSHRGRRLGLALKIEMLRWLRQDAPQLRLIRTYNNADNSFMISVNEVLGYRVSGEFVTWQRSR